MSIFKKLLGGAANPGLNNINSSEAFLVDVREPYEFAEGSVKGAVNIPLSSIPASLDAFCGKKDIVVFCRSGNRSAQAAGILKANGIGNVVNGGSWQQVQKMLQ